MASLRDQLLKKGVVDKGKAQKIKSEQKKQRKRSGGTNASENEAAKLVEAARREKAERDQAINKLQQEAAARKALEAQIIQLVDNHRIQCESADTAYRFTHHKKIKNKYVSEAVAKDIAAGRLSIVTVKDRYEVVPTKVAEKIAQRCEEAVLVKNSQLNDPSHDEDPYADYQIPDDLMW